MDYIGIIIGLLVGLIGGLGGGVVMRNKAATTARNEALKQVADEGAVLKEQAQRELDVAQTQAKAVSLAAKDEALKLRDDADREIKDRRAEVQREEDRQRQRRADVQRDREQADQLQRKLNQRQTTIDKREQDAEKLIKERQTALEQVASMNREEARAELLSAVREDSRNEMAKVIREEEHRAKDEADKRAREVVLDVIQRVATDTVAERTVSTIELPSEEIKGRIIGRNGRNVQAFEQAAGVDVIVDDSPETVTISCFDPVRREIARRALEGLLRDGRIHPQRIEKTLDDARRDVERVIRDEGERAVDEAGVSKLPDEIVRTLGRLRYRTSYGQNQLYHSVESARIAGMLASEFKANVKVCKMGGLLHDLGKALDRENEGTHVQLGVDMLRRFNIDPKVIHCVESHHHDVEQETIEAVIVEIADAMSGSRPGARRETLEAYVKRVRALEDTARGFRGVQEAYAVQAGREVRIIVRPEQIDDLRCIELSRDVAKKIEETMQFPGTIKVTVIREFRAMETAK